MCGPTTAIVYTDDELDAMRQVRTMLKEKHDIAEDVVGLKYIALTTIISKNRPDEACEKIVKFVKALEAVELGKNRKDDAPSPLTDDQLLLMASEEQLQEYLSVYHMCGVDLQRSEDDEKAGNNDGSGGRDSMWIRGDRVYRTPQEQQDATRAGILFHFATHCNPATLRRGLCHFVIDITNAPTEKTGSEAKLQKINQSYPLRPQKIYIAGASVAQRIIVNALIKVASLFTKVKILQRIQFVTVEKAINDVASATDGSHPVVYGGKGNGIPQDDLPQWVQRRIESFPVPEL